MAFPLRPSPVRFSWKLACACLWLLLGVATLPGAAPFPAEDPPRSVWLDLRPSSPGSPPQTVPAWVEAIEVIPPIPGDASPGEPVPSSTFRLRFGRPAGVGADDELLLRLFFRDGPGEAARPRVTAWDELGHRLLDSGPLGEGLPGTLSSSEALTVPMAGVNYLEIAAPDEAAVRGVQLQWLQRREAREPADAPTISPSEPERARELRVVAAGRQSADPYHDGTLTAVLQPGTVSVVGAGANSQQPGGLLLEFELERPPLAALLTFEILSDAPVDAPPQVFVNGRALGGADLSLPDLDDPGYQGVAATGNGSAPVALGFRYTGWLRARKVLPALALRPGVNKLLLQLSNDVAAGAVRAVDVQLKYSWEKLDYVVPPHLNPSLTR